ncbi:MAG TPA: HAD family hydrolase [Fimbriimonadaceae bacterium]|nr:HAD family hydrolase [Fimbriimonadaceae bacterium]HRJ96933.1 HAD family hydrolase [Fimbriimonadaceae bacterium]
MGPTRLRTEFDRVRAVFFDLDDTLCGYWQASREALHEAFTQHAPESHTAEEMVRAWARAFRKFSPSLKKSDWYATYLQRGEPTRTEQMRQTLAEVGHEDESRAQRLSETYARERDARLRLFPEAPGVLEALHGAYPLGLITNGPADIQRQEIETLGIGPLFDHILIEGEMGEGKPLPSVFRRAESMVGLPPAELLFVGNSYGHDILPAIEAGWSTAWIRRATDVPPSTDGSAQTPEDRPSGSPPPTLEIGSLIELLSQA